MDLVNLALDAISQNDTEAFIEYIKKNHKDNNEVNKILEILER